MPKIFVSYRRGDAAGHAGRLFDRLSADFGRDQIFMDVDGIQPGVDFVDAIEHAVGGCDVLLTVIGKNWTGAVDSEGRRRLDDPGDFVALETATALNRLRMAKAGERVKSLQVYINSNDHRSTCEWSQDAARYADGEWHDLALQLARADEGCQPDLGNVNQMGIKLFETSGPITLYVDRVWLE